MKVKVHMRVGREGNHGRPKVAVNVNPNYHPLENTQGQAIPTAMFAVELNVPESIIKAAERTLAEITIRPEDAAVAAEVRYPEESNSNE